MLLLHPTMRLKRFNHNVLALALASLVALAAPVDAAAQAKAPKMTKQERVCLRKGNKLYNQKRYAEAEVEYKKALEANPSSEKAQFNLATAYMRQGSATADPKDKNNPMNKAEGLLANLAKSASDKQLRGKAAYDLGNIAYSRQQYDQAIECYKQALRCNPDDDQARQNLRLAQLKKQQQDQNQDKDKNKDQQKQQPKEQMSKENAEQLLNAAMQEEKATQQRLKKAMQHPQKRQLQKNW